MESPCSSIRLIMSSVLQTCSLWLCDMGREGDIHVEGGRDERERVLKHFTNKYGTCTCTVSTTHLSWFGDYHRGCGVISMPTYLRLHCVLKKNNHMIITRQYEDSHRLSILQNQMGSTDFQSKSYACPLSAGRSSPVDNKISFINANTYSIHIITVSIFITPSLQSQIPL